MESGETPKQASAVSLKKTLRLYRPFDLSRRNFTATVLGPMQAHNLNYIWIGAQIYVRLIYAITYSSLRNFIDRVSLR